MIIIKIGLFGDADVGKSTVAYYLQNNTVNKNKSLTIGVDFVSKEVRIDNNNFDNKQIIKYQIWDTAGQELYNSIIEKYYSVNIPIFIFDVSNIESFEHIAKWLDNFNRLTRYPPIKKYLIGNKTDLPQKVSSIEISNFCKINNLEYFENSTLHNNNIDFVFNNITEFIKNKIKDKSFDIESHHITIEERITFDGYTQLNDQVSMIRNNSFGSIQHIQKWNCCS